jgi:hypothetical protein
MTQKPFFHHWRCVAVATFTACVACDPDPSRAESKIDGSGNTVALSARTVVWGEHVPRWTLAPMPLVRIGAGDHGQDDVVGHVAYATRVASGEVMIADASTGAVSVYDPDGMLIRRTGGYGEGPGELGTMTSVLRLGHDQVLVWDQMRQQVLTVPAQPATQNASYRLEQGPGYIDARHRMHAAIGEERYVIAWSSRSTPLGIQPGDTVRHPVAILHWDEMAAEVDTVLTLMGPLTVFNRVEVGPGSISGLSPLPLSAQVLATGGPEYIVASQTHIHDYHVFRPDGGAGQVLRITGGAEQPLIDARVIERYRAQYPHIDSVEAEGMAALLGERLPTHEALFLDGRHLWIELFQLPWERSQRHYVIVDVEQGEVVAELQAPMTITAVHDIHDGYLIGTVSDEHGETSVVVHRVMR